MYIIEQISKASAGGIVSMLLCSAVIIIIFKTALDGIDNE